MAIIYKIDIIEALKNKGISTYNIQKNNLLSGSTQVKLKNNDTTITLKNLDTLCKLLECQPMDLIEYIPD